MVTIKKWFSPRVSNTELLDERFIGEFRRPLWWARLMFRDEDTIFGYRRFEIVDNLGMPID